VNPDTSERKEVTAPLVAPVVLLVKNLVISHELEKDRIVMTTNETYPWSFVTQIFRNGYQAYLDISLGQTYKP